MMDNKIRMLELKRKNAIANMCKEWKEHGINISINDYLGVCQTLQIQKYIIKELDELDRKNKSIICGEGDVILKYIRYLYKNISKECEYIFFEAEATRIGTLRLRGEDIVGKSDFIIQKSEILNGGCSIFICSNDVDNGICIWRGEYDSRIYIW